MLHVGLGLPPKAKLKNEFSEGNTGAYGALAWGKGLGFARAAWRRRGGT